MKYQVQSEVITSRKRLFLGIKESKNSLFNKISEYAFSVRAQKKQDKSFLNEKKMTEIRNKSAQASRMRQQISTACRISRQRIFCDNFTSANEIRCFSREHIRDEDKL